MKQLHLLSISTQIKWALPILHVGGLGDPHLLSLLYIHSVFTEHAIECKVQGQNSHLHPAMPAHRVCHASLLVTLHVMHSMLASTSKTLSRLKCCSTSTAMPLQWYHVATSCLLSVTQVLLQTFCSGYDAPTVAAVWWDSSSSFKRGRWPDSSSRSLTESTSVGGAAPR